MTEKFPPSSPEVRNGVADDARKFVLPGLSLEYLYENGAESYMLITNWTETNEDNETKVAYKLFRDNPDQILLIKKAKVDGERTAKKIKISAEEYEKNLKESKIRIEKERFEFRIFQNGKWFDAKYDEFVGSELRILEVDAKTPEERLAFDYRAFATDLAIEIKEVSDDKDYEGFRVKKYV